MGEIKITRKFFEGTVYERDFTVPIHPKAGYDFEIKEMMEKVKVEENHMIDKGKTLNGLAYILPKILKAEKVIKYWNGDIVEGEVINIAIFKDQIVIRTYKNAPEKGIEKSLVINKE